ncbi:proteasome assembly chaperone 3-like [Styela clava]
MDGNTKDPLLSESYLGEIDGHMTDVLTASFSDHNFLLVTQYKKFGTMIHVALNESMLDKKVSSMPTFTTKVLLGDDREMYHVFARAVASLFVEKTNKNAKKIGVPGIHKPLLCNFALKNPSKVTLHELKNILEKQLERVL